MELFKPVEEKGYNARLAHLLRNVIMDVITLYY